MIYCYVFASDMVELDCNDSATLHGVSNVWFCTKFLKNPFSIAINCSYGPNSATRPSSSTQIFCAFRIVLKRWAIVKTVRPFDKFSNEFCTSDSDTASSAEVASSRMRIDGFCSKGNRMKIFGKRMDKRKNLLWSEPELLQPVAFVRHSTSCRVVPP